MILREEKPKATGEKIQMDRKSSDASFGSSFIKKSARNIITGSSEN